MGSAIVLQRNIDTIQHVNGIYKRAQSMAQRPVPLFDVANAGLRVARSSGRGRAQLAAVFERCAELFDRYHDAERGQTRRSAEEGHAQRFEVPELALFKEAYRALQDGLFEDMSRYSFLYGAAAWHEGIIDGPCGWGWWEE